MKRAFLFSLSTACFLLPQHFTFGQVLTNNLIRNGSFEQLSPLGSPLYWANTVRPNQILFAADGRWAVALTGFVQGPTSQSVSTVPGTAYELRFALREPIFGTDEFEGSATRQPDGTWVPDGPWVANVGLNGTLLGSFENDNTNLWQYFTVDFTATSPITSVEFFPGAAGSPLLDNVTLHPVAEPSATSFMLVGAASFGLSYRFRRRQLFREPIHA
jgi:hypothetical protein